MLITNPTKVVVQGRTMGIMSPTEALIPDKTMVQMSNIEV